ncbi:hypothetical protein [Cellulomonas edaphi]|uniref:Restriction endonuclease type II-like domain-containing protein n=1 Tax=Cellulomonas edaphi TaxID=3053468 RepID=A0ABT7S4T0_9CELL|nr:hypothetical protein [Cellulomons edaphi]MDM7830635.1 hypothetical protein [Cellulomons edaphi]
MTVPARVPGTGTTPGQVQVPVADNPAVVLVEPPSADELVEGAVATWRAALVEAAGGSTLADVELLGDAALDLSAAHPSGMAQLFAGRETRLSNLVREGSALSTARRRARAVGARSAAYAQQYGIAPTSVAIGVATWTERTAPEAAQDDVAALASITRQRQRPDDEPADRSPRTVRAPVLLRPVTLRARGTGEADYELALEPSLEVNPVLARALRSRGALLDPGAVARGAFTPSGFDPRAALKRLASLGEAVLEDFALAERVVVGTFVHPGQVLVDDLDQLAGTLDRHEVVAALAGVDADALAGRALPEPVVGDRDPALERGVGDLDPAQQHVLDVVATGTHLFVDAPTGADVTGTLAALVADAAASGRTVLYVPGHRRSATALVERLERLGLGDLVLDVAPEAGWRTTAARRLLGAMTLEVPGVDAHGLHTLRSELVARREQLRGYVVGLHAPREPWGVSAYDALQQLARLTSTRPTPRTTVRLAPDVTRVLDAAARADLADALTRVGELGAFRVRPTDTPWYGADLRTRADADVAVRRLERLLDSGIPTLLERTEQVANETGLNRATTLAAWSEQLAMLDGVRAALDVFQPIVFERTASDLVAATATAQWRQERGIDMGSVVRRRLRKQAKDMVRPGRPVADLHGALLEVAEQRQIWHAHCPGGGWPRLPDGLEQIEEELAALRGDIEALDGVLATTPDGAGLSDLPLSTLLERLTRLRAGADALDTLPDRTALLHRLRGAGLGELVDDLAHRSVDPGLAAAELDLAWWSTVIEQILGAEPTLAGYDGTALGSLAAQYAQLDREHVARLSGPVLTGAVAHVSTVLRQHRAQAEDLFAELVEERLTSLRDTFGRHPDVARRLRPIIAASPMLVPQVLPPSRTVDLVVIDSAAHLPVEMALAAVSRGRQVVVVGDARCASGTAVRELAGVLPGVALHARASRRDPYLTAFLARHGYEGVLSALPLPQQEPLVHLELVDGTGMPDGETGMVATTAAEVDRVLEVVLDHALSRPEESLAVVTVTPAHAEAVREAVLAEVRTNPALAAFFDAGRAEPFVVTDLTNVAGLRRDAVLLTFGLGRTPHRRVLHTFGPISGPGGDALLLDALGSTAHRLTVVSCFAADDLDRARLRGPGPRLLRDLLAFAASRAAGGTELEADWTEAPLAPEAGSLVGIVSDAVAAADGLREDSGVGSDSDASAESASDSEAGSGSGSADAPTGAASSADAGPQGARTDEVPTGDDASHTQAGPVAGAAPTDAPAADQHPAAAPEPDRLLLDLAERLWRHGLVVDVDYGIPGGTRIPMVVGHPDVPGRMLVAVLTDDDAYVAEPSIRVRERLVADRLADLGWSVIRVWSAAAFLDPQAEVDRIRRAVHACVPAQPVEPRSATLSVPVVVESEQADDVVAVPAPVASGQGDERADDERMADERAVAVADGARPDEPAGAPGADAPHAGVIDEAAAPVADARDAGVVDRAAPDSVPTASRPAPADDEPARHSQPMATVHGGVMEILAPVEPALPGALLEVTVSTPAAGVLAPSPKAAAAVKRATDAADAEPAPASQPLQLVLAVPTRQRPDVRKGLPIGAYSDDQLDELVAWLRSDGQERTRDQLAAALRDELGITRRSYRVDTAVRGAVTRGLASES